MKFSLRHDSDLPADQLFRAVSDFDRIERMLARRGIEARRGEVVAPALGAAWDIGFDLRGKRRELQLELVEFAAPERIAMTGVGEGLDISIAMTVVALTRAKSRAIFEVEIRPRHMRARLMLQTAKLGKSQLDRKFADRAGRFLNDLTSQQASQQG
ncbi:MAG TPA: SRPBCC family protein [Paracoccus sp.]|nr:SRPBCC family protein [Paracoccus sp. (in: a-proteobacteria)]